MEEAKPIKVKSAEYIRGRTSLEDDPRERHPKIQDMVLKNRRLAERFSRGSIHLIKEIIYLFSIYIAGNRFSIIA